MGKGRQLGGHDAKDWSKDFRIYRSQSCHCFDFNSKVPILIKFFLIVSMWPGNSEKDTKDAKEMKEDLVTWLWRGCFANCQGDLPRFRCCFGRGCWEATSRKIHSRKVCQAQGETTRSVSVKYFTSDFLRAWTPGGCVEIPATWKMKVKKSYLSIAFHCTLEPGTCPWLAWLLMTPPCVCETKCFFSCVWSEFGSHTGHFDVFCFMWLLAEALKVWEGTVPVAKETWFMHGFKSGSPANISSVYHSQWSCHGFMPIEVNKNTLSVLNCIIRYYSYIRTHTHVYIYMHTYIYGYAVQITWHIRTHIARLTILTIFLCSLSEDGLWDKNCRAQGQWEGQTFLDLTAHELGVSPWPWGRCWKGSFGECVGL